MHNGHDIEHRHHGHVPEPTARASATRDPVCGMAVERATAKHHVRHDGVDHFFCSANCKAKFQAEPRRYLTVPATPRTTASDEPTAPAGTIYTCPMHPQIRQPKPGNCPI